MLLKHDVLTGIADGRIVSVYRRWAQPRVKTGSMLRTAIGLIEVLAVEPTVPHSLTTDDAREAGYDSIAGLISSAGSRGETLYRIRVRYAGDDPRVTLRTTIPDAHALIEIERRLDSLDSGSRHGPWTRETLELIADRPGVRAEDLARSVGREKLAFKLDVRKLKELGLTESLETGYRLSPRGQAVVGGSAR
jgi:hypothetical protein